MKLPHKQYSTVVKKAAPVLQELGVMAPSDCRACADHQQGF